MRLNLGCGPDLWGDVRLDNHAEDYLVGVSYPDIVADAQYLPFKSRAFKSVKASHILEHVSDWRLAIKEWARVTDSNLEIRIPYESHHCKMVLEYLLSQGASLSGMIKHLLVLNEWTRQHLWQFKGQRRLAVLRAVLGINHLETQEPQINRRVILAFATYGRKRENWFFRGLTRITFPYEYRILSVRMD